MQEIIRDITGIAGVGCASAGVWVQFGIGYGLITLGALLLGLALKPD